jgi:hypothetical protein
MNKMHLKHQHHIQSSAIQATHNTTQYNDLININPALRQSVHRSPKGK